jgi:hypothetical protein
LVLVRCLFFERFVLIGVPPLLWWVIWDLVFVERRSSKSRVSGAWQRRSNISEAAPLNCYYLPIPEIIADAPGRNSARAWTTQNWLFEVKYDGFRALAYLERGTVRLVSRKGNVYKSFPPLCQSLAACVNADDAVLDDEIVYLGPGAAPRFSDLMHRLGTTAFLRVRFGCG